ncbi:gliding motility-associated C-terminal domain-containing protein [Rapidithrix thailandica]|uniref:Gliding motility-associated C-terminal domain-containing protein n=1 Tax=Rapidithrix thailandica TaxID=413964 RepID=A0AAW9S5W9_9BACT
MKNFKLLFFISSILLILSTPTLLQASHIRAGDLTARRAPDGDNLTYIFTVMLYRDTEGVEPSPGEIRFGDGSEMAIVDFVSLGLIDNGQTEVLRYEVRHSFPSAGMYKVSFYQRDRNQGVNNMSNSGSTPFYIESSFLISPTLGYNASPTLLMPPIEKATIGQRYIHNPGAFDAEGDSIAYEITICKRGPAINGEPRYVDRYTFPNHSNWSSATEEGQTPPILSLNPITGDLIWDAPGVPGEYNVAFYINEYRNGVLISQVNRDMQIIVEDCDNRRPKVKVPEELCVIAGETLEETIIATDQDGDDIKLFASNDPKSNPDMGGNGGIFDLPSPSKSATFTNTVNLPGRAEGTFKWEPHCNDIREQPYQAIFKANDLPSFCRPLADIQVLRIKVVGPPPQNLQAQATANPKEVQLTWDTYECALPGAKMTIWRKVGSSGFVPDNCETGLPASSGYEKIAEVPVAETSYIDSGLKGGQNYCYRIFVDFAGPKGGESLASDEACVFIPTFAPYITKVSVEKTSQTEGEIQVEWTEPIDVDPVQFPGPYTYQLIRSEGYEGNQNEAVLPASPTSDRTFTDTGLNTEELVYNYRVILYSQGNEVDTSPSASSVRLQATPTAVSIDLDWSAMVPWNNLSPNYKHKVYRKLEDEPVADFVLIDEVDVAQSGMRYSDKGTYNNEPLDSDLLYCYRIETQGTYERAEIVEPLLNYSQILCESLLDTVPPCAPILTLEPLDCEQFTDPSPGNIQNCQTDLYENRLTWTMPQTPECSEKPRSYNLYYTPSSDTSTWQLLVNTPDTFFVHEDLISVAGCYAVTALDKKDNESILSNIECNDNCPYYELPNVFTPNGDGINDTFTPFPCPRFVEKVEFKVFNRWGELVYESDDDIYLNWDGRNKNDQQLSAGVYYYEAKVRFYSLNPEGTVKRLKGWVQILSGERKD